MKLILLFITSLLFVISAEAYVGFEGGNEFQVTDISGTLHVTCASGTEWETRTDYCRGTVAEPGTHAYFIYDDEPVNATHVTLKNQVEEDKVEEKTEKFLTEEGRSKKRFNLLVWTLFQDPLLHRGENKVDYVLKRDSEVIKKGHVNVNVSSGEARQCRTRSMRSHDMNDCRASGRLCSRYFWQENYCISALDNK